jgi:hypothetical protein
MDLVAHGILFLPGKVYKGRGVNQPGLVSVQVPADKTGNKLSGQNLGMLNS